MGYHRRLTLLSAVVLLLSACSAGSTPAPSSSVSSTTPPVSQAPASQAPGSPAGTAFSVTLDWGTFTLSPDAQKRVKDKVAKGDPLDIPVFAFTTGSEFYGPVRASTKDALAKLNVSSQLLGPVEASAPTVINDIESYLSRQPDGIAIDPGNPDDFTQIFNKIIEAGIPAVAWNQDVPKSKRLAYIGPDNAKFGEKLGELMVQKLQTKGVSSGTIQIFCVDCTAGYSHDGRIPGFEKVVSATFPNIKYAEPVTVGSDVSSAVAKVDAAVRAQTDLVGLYTTDELVNASAVWAKQNGGKATKDKYVIVGHNLLPSELTLMADGYIDALAGQDPYGQGMGSISWLKTFLTTGQQECGPICLSPMPSVDTPEKAKQMVDSNCDGKGCA